MGFSTSVLAFVLFFVLRKFFFSVFSKKQRKFKSIERLKKAAIRCHEEYALDLSQYQEIMAICQKCFVVCSSEDEAINTKSRNENIEYRQVERSPLSHKATFSSTQLLTVAERFFQSRFWYYLLFIVFSVGVHDMTAHFFTSFTHVLCLSLVWLLFAAVLPKKYVDMQQYALDAYASLLIVYCCRQFYHIHYSEIVHLSFEHYEFVISGWLLCSCVFIYQARWLWVPTFLVSCYSVYAVVSSFGNYQYQWLICALAAEIGIFTFIGHIIYRLNKRHDVIYERFVRSICYKCSARNLLRPMLYLISLSLMAAIGLSIYKQTFLQTSIAGMLAFLSMSIIAVSIPTIFSFPTKLTWLAQVLFLIFAVPACVNYWWYGMICFSIGSLVFICSAFIVKCISALYLGLLFFTYSLYRLAKFTGLSYEWMLLLATCLALLWAFLCFFVHNKKCNYCFQRYSFGTGALTIAGLATMLIENFHSSSVLIVVALLMTFWSFVHYLRHRENGAVFVFFMCIAGVIILSCEYFFPKMLQIQAVGLAICAFVWWRLQRLLLLPTKSFLSYSSVLTLAIYGLSTKVIFDNQDLDLYAMIAMGAVTVYASLVAFYLNSTLLLWVYAFFVHQLGFVLFLFNGTIVFAHALESFVYALIFVLWVARHYQAPQFYLYVSTMLMAIVSAIISARVYSYGDLSVWLLSSNLTVITSVVLSMYVYFCSKTRVALILVLLSTALCSTLLLDYGQYTSIYYAVFYSYLGLLFTIMQRFAKKKSLIATTLSEALCIFTTGLFVNFYLFVHDDYWQLYRYHLVFGHVLFLLSITYFCKYYLSRISLYSYLCLLYWYLLCYIFIEIYCAPNLFYISLLAAALIALGIGQIMRRKANGFYHASLDSATLLLGSVVGFHIPGIKESLYFLHIGELNNAIVIAWGYSIFLLMICAISWRKEMISLISVAAGAIVFDHYPVLSNCFHLNHSMCDWSFYALVCFIIGLIARSRIYHLSAVVLCSVCFAVAIVDFEPRSSLSTMGIVLSCSAIAAFIYRSLWLKICALIVFLTVSSLAIVLSFNIF